MLEPSSRITPRCAFCTACAFASTELGAPTSVGWRSGPLPLARPISPKRVGVEAVGHGEATRER